MNFNKTIFTIFLFIAQSISAHPFVDDYVLLMFNICFDNWLSNRMMIDKIYKKVHVNDKTVDAIDKKLHYQTLFDRDIYLGFDCLCFMTALISYRFYLELEWQGHVKNGYITQISTAFHCYKALVYAAHIIVCIKTGYLVYRTFPVFKNLKEKIFSRKNNVKVFTDH